MARRADCRKASILIYETDGKQFATIMVVTWQSYGRNKPEGPTMRFWFDKLIGFDFTTVSNAFDEWLKTQKELPTVNEILKLCQPKEDVYKALPRPVSNKKNAEYAENVISFIAENTEKKKGRNWIKYWEDILKENKIKLALRGQFIIFSKIKNQSYVTKQITIN
jgi:hypothetical protein